MRRLRFQRTPAFLLTLMMALAVLLPEASHSLAHRDGAGHSSHHHEHHAGGHTAGPALSTSEADGNHHHADFRATLPSKSLLNRAVAAQVLIRLDSDLADTRRLPASPLANIAPLPSHHGPPPPTRAPPTV